MRSALPLILMLMPMPLWAQNDCVKLVFENYCLGGSPESLPEPAHREGMMLFYGDPKERTVVVRVFEDKIVAVSEFHPKPSWPAVRRLEKILRRIYGKAQDESYFPSYADDDDSQALAIRGERGEFKRRWKLPDFEILLVWKSPERFFVVYITEGFQRSIEAEERQRY